MLEVSVAQEQKPLMRRGAKVEGYSRKVPLPLSEQEEASRALHLAEMRAHFSEVKSEHRPYHCFVYLYFLPRAGNSKIVCKTKYSYRCELTGLGTACRHCNSRYSYWGFLAIAVPFYQGFALQAFISKVLLNL